MTVPGATTPQPGRALHSGRPAGRLWALVLVGLLALLPCAGRAAAQPGHTAAMPRAAGFDPSGLSTPASSTTATAATAATAAETVSALSDGKHHSLQGGHLANVLADAGLPLTLCAAGELPSHPGDGCSDHPFCGSESQLPNAPPQPATTAPALLVPDQALPCPVLGSHQRGAAPAPDLHVLQVHRI
ncbi:hypothetical protein ABT095_27615 [Kitasatospora sp. NPDC002227]|uniref:hypothetical protein n=1 Tax=Kitasatospora sp. NPDC002227 TaxID=3154773 RepID=UPI003323F676